MSSELAIAPKSLDEAKSLSAILSKTGLVPEALRGKEADILFVVLTGAEMGLGPMKSLQAFESIKGRVGMKPVWMLGMVRSHPSIEDITLDSTPTKAVCTSQRKGSPKILRTEFTMEDAKTAGLTSSDMYRKWPARMLGWRCTAIHCREHHSDIIGGHYSSEEIESFEERDVTPKSVASTVVEKTEALKRRLNIVDEAPVPQPSPPSATLDPVAVGWGKHAALPLAELTDEKLRWYLDDAEKKAASKAGDESLTWAAHHARYVAEAERRAVAPAPFAPGVTP